MQNGIDPRDLEPVVTDLDQLRAQYANPDERLVLLVGRLVYEKGFHLALDALAPVIRKLGGVRFVVAGTGTAEAELRARRGVSGSRARALPGLGRRRHAPLALSGRRSVHRPLDLRAIRPRGARGDGLWLPVHRRRHGRATRGRARRRHGRLRFPSRDSARSE